MRSKKFKLPQSPPGTGLDDKAVLVISFFGKSPHNAAGCKTGLLDGLLGRTVFQSSMLDDPCIEDTDALCDIEGYYDEGQKIIFLHLRGVFDTHSLVKIYDQFQDKLDEDGYLTVWSEMNCRYARALLLLFSISHILILSQPSHTFDLGYLPLFRSLDNIRQKLQPQVVELLSSLPRLPKDWAANGRPCSPRVLFAFESCPAIYRQGNGVGTYGNSVLHGWSPDDELVRPSSVAGDNRAKPSIKRLEHALEDQIYHILRQGRIIANVSTNSLFAIPANQEFVFVSRSGNDAARGRLHFLARSLVALCNHSAANSTTPRQDSDSFATVNTLAPGSEHSLRALLQQHVDQAFGKGFDDNVGRNAPPSFFEMASASVWHSAAAALHAALVGPSSWDTVAPSVTALLGTDVRFSDARCGKVLPIATATYQENLPPHYTRDYHETRLSRAMSVLAAHARGPLYGVTRTRLAAECLRWWRQGRQVCEVLSLTGHPCTAPLHRGGGKGAGGGQLQLEPDVDAAALPCRGHSSGVRFVAACNCGRSHGPRDDPFSARTANHDFYQRLAEDCGCAALESFRFPVFTPSTQDYRAAQLFQARPSVKSATPAETEGPPMCEAHSFSLAGFVSDAASACSDLLAEDDTSRTSPPPASGLACDWPAGSALASDWPQADAVHADWPTSSTTASDWLAEGNDIVIQVSVQADAEHSKEKGLVRQPSTTEYLPGMLHTNSPSGLLPRFPSWSLTCLGASSLYSHNLGLQDQPNLLPGSAFLLPWDVAVRLHGHRERCWPAVGDGTSFGPRGKSYLGAATRGRKPKPLAKDSSEFVVKLFVGVEYECPRGHRFMCSGPDRVLKASGSGLVKDTGNRVAANDMPLYCACPCRSSKPLVAQLMRVHVVTPKAPVFVTLSPRVQPAPAPCAVFVPGADKPLRLAQSSYWVLRLPFVYVGDHGPLVAPKEPVSPGYGRLLAGTFSISEQPPQE